METTQGSRVALVTGASTGIGFEMSRQLLAGGVTVIVGARSGDKAESTASALRKEAPAAPVHPLKLDVTDEKDVLSAVRMIEQRFGRLDILVNNAGVLLEPLVGNSTGATSTDVLRRTFESNFFSLVSLTQALLPLLKRSAAGRIVNLSSVLASLTVQSAAGSPIEAVKPFAYDASKAAVNVFTIHLAHELRGTSVKVNSAHPGWVKTALGGGDAPMEIVDGAKTGVALALLGADGPSGGFFHMGEAIAW